MRMHTLLLKCKAFIIIGNIFNLDFQHIHLVHVYNPIDMSLLYKKTKQNIRTNSKQHVIYL